MTAGGARGGWALLRPALAEQYRALLALACWSLLEALPVLLSGRLVATAVDRGFLAGRPGVGLGLLAVYGTAMLAGAWGARQVVVPLATVVESVRDRLVRVVVAASLRRAAHGDGGPDDGAVARITRQVELVRQMVAALLMTSRTVVFSTIAVLAGLVTLLPQLAWVTAAALGLSVALLAALSPALRRRYLASLTAEERLADEAGRIVDGLRDVLACGAATTATRQVGRAVEAQAAASMAAARAGAGRIGVIAVGARLPLLAAMFLASGLAGTGAASPGQLLGAATYLITGLEPALRSVVNGIGDLGLQLWVVLGRLGAGAAMPAAPAQAGRTARTYDLELRGVTFRYSPYSAAIVDRLDLTIRHGEHLAVVGPSGIGKSTLAQLLAGLETPQEGEVTLGGVPLPALAPAWLRRTVALVPQESYVFAGTLRENLTYLAPDASRERLDAAVDALGLGPTVRRVGGYGADIGNAEALSQGERQLITLARVYLSGAGVVLLDEATCHLDPVAEARVEEAFAARGGTLVVVAHRISSAMRAHRILVLDGTSASSGDHATLLAESRLYADLAGHWGTVRQAPAPHAVGPGNGVGPGARPSPRHDRRR